MTVILTRKNIPHQQNHQLFTFTVTNGDIHRGMHHASHVYMFTVEIKGFYCKKEGNLYSIHHMQIRNISNNFHLLCHVCVYGLTVLYIITLCITNFVYFYDVFVIKNLSNRVHLWFACFRCFTIYLNYGHLQPNDI